MHSRASEPRRAERSWQPGCPRGPPRARGAESQRARPAPCPRPVLTRYDPEMPAPTPPFDALRSRLARRRFGSVDRRLRVELAGLGLLLGAFAFWQLRVRLAGVAFDHGV